MAWVVDERFEILELLGTGGMGEVYRARVPRQAQEVAVKVLTARTRADGPWREAFRNEVRLAASLSHPHVVRVLDHGTIRGAPGRPELEGAPYLAMEIAAGVTLDRYLGALGWGDLRAVLLALLGAFAHAHSRGVIHRDTKPSNVLLDLDAGELKLTDFGLAHALDRSPVEGERVLVGTPLYMAPEQFTRNWRDFGPWTDLYGLGCVAYALASGAPPFPHARSVSAARSAHRYSDVPALPTGAPVPEGFEAWLADLLEKDPGRRFQRAADAAVALRELPDDAPDPSPQSAGGAFADSHTLTSQFFDGAEATDEVAREVRTTIALSAGLRVSERPPPPLPRDWRHSEWTAPPDRLGITLFGMREAPLVGRSGERDRLWAALDGVIRDRRPAGVVLTGPRGIGKSRLARWLAERAHALGVAHILEARHAAGGGDGQGLGAMVARFLRCTRMEPAELAERLRHITVGLDPDSGMWRALLELVHPGAPGGVLFADEPERHRALASFLGRLARTRVLVLWLDDVHLAPRSLAFAQYLLTCEVPVLVVCTADRSLPGGLGLDERPVGPLSPDQMRGMLGSLVLLDPLLMDDVGAVTAGNPLLALQLVGQWIDGDRLRSVTTGWRLDRRGDAARELATIWEDRLAPCLREHGEVLELAAVVGTELDSTSWRAVGGSHDALDALMRRGLVVPTDPTDPSAWRFTHGHIRDALLRRSERAGRLASLHRVAADLTGPDDPERRARHLWAAGDGVGAEPLLLQAAQLAHERGEYVRGHEVLDVREEVLGALAVSSTDPRQVAGDIVRARILRREGRVGDARALADRLQGRVPRGEGALWVEARLLSCELTRKLSKLADVVDALQDALTAARRVPDDALRARVLLELAEVEIDQGALDDAERHLQESLPLADAAGGRRTVARAWQQLAELGKERGDFDRAWAHYERAEEACAALGDRWGRASVLNSMGDVARYRGELDAAVTLYERAGGVFGEIGSDSRVYTEYNIALVRLEQRDWPAVRAVLAVAMPAFLAMGHRATWADTLLVRAACRAVEGKGGVEDDLACALAVYVETGVNDADSAELAETVGRILEEVGRSSEGAVRVARHVWTELGREDRLERYSAALEPT